MTESQATLADGVGARLERARNRLGLTRVQAGERLRLEPQAVESMETEQFAQLGASVYVRGHLRRYADLVGEDAAELEQMYARRPEAATVPDIARMAVQPVFPTPRTGKLPLGLIAGLAALLLIAGVLWWAYSSPPPAAAGSETVELGATTPASIDPPAEATAPAATAPAPTAVNPAARAPTSAAGPSARLTLSLLADSSIEVYDGSGARLYQDSGNAGSVLNLDGRAPFRIALGNAAGVLMDLNGRRVALPLTVGESGTAWLSLDASGRATRVAANSR